MRKRGNHALKRAATSAMAAGRPGLIEPMERRILLAVTTGEYDQIRSTYADFGLPADMSSINIVEIGPDQLSAANLQQAIDAAAGTTAPELIVARTTADLNVITYGSSLDELKIDPASAQGAISIVGFGPRPLTLNGGNQCSVLSVGSGNSSPVVNLGGLILTNGWSYDGAGVYQQNGMSTLVDVTITRNTAEHSGGGMYLGGGTSTIEQSVITDNTARYGGGGGGVYQAAGALTLQDVTISSNAALPNTTGDGQYSHGGGAWLGASCTLKSVAVSGNAADYGGGIYTGGDLSLEGVTIDGNTAAHAGAGIYQANGSLAVTGAVVRGNTGLEDGVTPTSGGGLFLFAGNSRLTNAIVFGNTASLGGGIEEDGGTLLLTNVTISGNMASGGGGIDMVAGAVTAYNSIIAENSASGSPDVNQAWNAPLSGAHNLVGDGTGQTSLLNGVDGNIVGASASPVDPQLAQGTNNGIGMSPLAGSPVIGVGDDTAVPAGITTDVYGAARIQGAHVDMGAVETVLPRQPGVTYVVTSLDDSIAADGVLTLREALAAANTNMPVGDAPAGSYSSPNRIEFAPGLKGTILTDGEAYRIESSVDLVGPGAGELAIDARGSSGVLEIAGMYDVNIDGVTLTGGRSEYGGALCSMGANVTLDHAVIAGNTSSKDGGGVYQSRGKLALTDVFIGGNTASMSGGGLCQSSGESVLADVVICGNAASMSGGGLCQQTGPATLTNVTIAGNAAAKSGGGACLDALAILNNSIIAGNTGPWADVYYSSGTAGTGNLIGDGFGSGWFLDSRNLVGTPSHRINPMFISMTGTDWTKWDLRLQSTSPALNAGDNGSVPPWLTTDIAGNPRIVGGTVDMGAYEANLDVALSTTHVMEYRPAPMIVGVLSNPDGRTFTYSLPHSLRDNRLFTVVGNQLMTAASFSYAAKNSYSILVKSVDQNGVVIRKAFTINVDQDHAPTNITLSSTTVAGNMPVGTRVGVLRATDPDAGEVFTYMLPPSFGDNQYFQIVNGKLKTNAVFDASRRSSYRIKVRATDLAGKGVAKVFSITIGG